MTGATITALTMPKWGLAMREGLVAAWHIEEGAPVEKGQDTLDIETEKITNVCESPASGVLRRRLVAAGETAPVGALLAVVAGPSVSEAALDAFIEAFHQQFRQDFAAAQGGSPAPQSIEAGGRRLRYLAMGTAGAAPLLLIHGFGGDLNNWLFNQPALAESRQVYALDLPGHGGSTKSLESTSLPGLAAAVREFLDSADLPAVHLAGHSLGGAVALCLARDAPRRVRSLTLIASAALGPEINIDYLRGFVAARRRKDLKAVVELLFAQPALVRREMLDDILKFKRIDGVPQLLTRIIDDLFPGGRQGLVLRDVLARMEMPCQVIWGAEDRILPPRHAAGFPASLPSHVLQDAGHMVHMEKAAEVNALIEALIGSVEP